MAWKNGTKEDTSRRKMGKGKEGEHMGGKGRALVIIALPESDLFYFVFPEIPRDSPDSHRGISKRRA